MSSSTATLELNDQKSDTTIAQDWPRIVATKESAMWLGASAVLMTIGLVKGINLLALVSYVSFAFLLLNTILAWRMVLKVSAVRVQPQSVFAGESVAISGRVKNQSNGRAVLSLQEATTINPRAWFLPALPGGVMLPFAGATEFPTRGVHSVPAIEAISSYPFGLMTCRRMLLPATEVVILPALGYVDLALLRRWILRNMATDDSHRRVVRRVAPADGDVRGLRPYRDGDSPRDVHWRSSARRGQLIVREYDRNAPLDLVIVVDPWLPVSPDAQASAKLERILSMAVSVAWAWVHAEMPGSITLMVAGPEWVITHGSGTPSFVRSGFAALGSTKGSSVMGPPPPDTFQRTVRASRLVLSTRPNSPVLGHMRAAGLTLAFLDASVQPNWFNPRAPLA